MCDADDLSALRRLLQLFTDAPCRQTGDPGVDLIVDHSADIIFIRQCAFDSQHDARKLAAGCDLCQRLGLFARVRRDVEFNGVLSAARQRAFFV